MIYLFNNKEELIHIIKEQDLIEFTHKIEINTFDAAEFELPIEAIDKEIIEQMRFFGFFVRGRQFGVFKAYEVTTTDNYVVKGLDRAESDLRTVRIIKDKRLQSVTADQALNVALEGTGYQLGVKEGLTKVNKTNFYYISPREALVKIIEAFNCEFRVRYEFVENKIINRYIDLYHRQGSYSGVQFEYGNNALEVTMEEDSDNVVTALIGRGKGEESTDSEGNATGGYGRRIEFADIVWTKASGNPIDKPAGQNYIVLNDDIENKGLYQNGELKHRWGVFVDEEIEDKEVLLQATYQELLRLNNPIRKYKASILDLRDDIWLGDRVAIVKDSAKLSFEARIFSITIDKLNFDQSEVELGDYETLKSRSQSSSLNAIKEAVRELSEEQEAYNRKVQELIDNKNAEIAEKMRVMRLDMDNGIEDAKNKAEVLKKKVTDSVNSKFADFDRSFNTQIDSQKERIQAISDLANNANQVAAGASWSGQKAIEYALSVKGLADHNFTAVRNLSDKIDLLATKQELDPITERLRLTESQIELQAGQITEKLSRTEVDRLIDGKGFQNAVQVQNLVKKSVDGFQQTISRVENKLRDVIRNDNLLQNSSVIPGGNGLEGTWQLNNSGGNGKTEVIALTGAPHTAIKKGIRVVGNTNGGNKDISQGINLVVGEKYTISCWARVSSNSTSQNVNLIMRSWTTNDRNRVLFKSISNKDWVRYQFTFTADAAYNSIQFGQNGNGSIEICGMKLEKGDRATDYDVSNSEIVSIVEFNDVVDTVKSHTQTIQRQNESISQVIQTADGLVSRVSNFLDDFNLVYDPTNVSKWKKKQPEANIVEVQASTKLLRITNSGNTNNVYRGFALPITTSSFTKDEKLSYRIEVWVDVLPDAPLGIELWSDNTVIASDRVTFSKTGKQVITGTMTVNKTTTNSRDYPLEFWLLKNGTVAIGKVSLIRGDRPPKKFTDNTSTQDVATQTQVSQLAGSYAIKNLNSAGDIINGVNIGADGNNRFIGKLTHITGETLIDKAVIKSAMVDKLKTGNFESGSVTTQILASNAVTADKLLVDSAMINKLVSNQAFIKELFTQRATITQIQSIDITGEHVRGGRITSLNGTTNFDLQTGWIDMNENAVGIRNQFGNKPIQYLVFGEGAIGNKPGTYTALMSNSNKRVAMDDGSAGIQIWNTNDNTTAVNIYGDMVEFMYNATDPKSIAIDTVTNVIWNIEDIILSSYGNYGLKAILNDIYRNIRQLHDVTVNRVTYDWTTIGPR